LTIPITTSPQNQTFTFPEPVNSIVFDPNTWLLKKVQVVNSLEELVQESSNTILVFPNPFRNRTNFLINNPATRQIEIYDIVGIPVKSLFTNSSSPVKHFIWDGNDEKGKPLASGIYFAKIVTKNRTTIQKLLLLK
jgi:hypothetical protein